MQAAGLFTSASRSIAPRKPLTVSQWADANRILSSKASAIPGRWVTDRTPMLREPMDCMSARSPVQEVVCIFPIQFGKSEFETNVIGYTMCENPGPIRWCRARFRRQIHQPEAHPREETTPAPLTIPAS